MGDFAADTEVSGGRGRYDATLSADWRIWGPNGGCLAAIALRAAGRATRLPRPVSFSCHFLSVAEFGEVEIDVVPLRTGRRTASLRVSVRQGERSVLEAIVWAADHLDGLVHVDARAPEVPPPESLRPIEDTLSLDELASFYPFWSNSDWLLCDAHSPIAREGLVATDARVWSAGGRLLASGGSQLLCRPVPAAT